MWSASPAFLLSRRSRVTNDDWQAGGAPFRQAVFQAADAVALGPQQQVPPCRVIEALDVVI